MKMLYDEVTRRFPEIHEKIFKGDEELPYVLVGHLADWLKVLPQNSITPQLVARLVSFTKWCEEQPRGQDASDDLHTILTVGFYEDLFDSDSTRALVARLISRDDFIANSDYLRFWVGTANYDATRKYYKPAD